jgi:hypothetical protein
MIYSFFYICHLYNMSIYKAERLARINATKKRKTPQRETREELALADEAREKSRLIQQSLKGTTLTNPPGHVVYPGGDRVYGIHQGRTATPLHVGIGMFNEEMEKLVQLNLNTMKLAFMMGTRSDCGDSTLKGLPYAETLFQKMNELNYVYAETFKRIEADKSEDGSQALEGEIKLLNAQKKKKKKTRKKKKNN